MKTIALVLLALTAVFTAGSDQSSAKAPEVTAAVAPTFPPILVAAHINGKAVVEATINAKGEVTSSRVVDGHPLIRQMTKLFDDTLRRWRFVPAAEGDEVRKASLTFVFTIVPERTPEAELATVFRPPYEVEVKHRPASETYRTLTNADPPNREVRQSRSKKTKPESLHEK